MNPLDPKLLVFSVAATFVLFAVSAFFTRATLRRMVGVLIGAIPIIPMVMFFDGIAAQRGWWYYPAVTTGDAPLAWYVSAALFYGAALGLVGWRVIRRYGWRGLIGFILAFALFGLMRDYLYSVTTRLIVFGPGMIPLTADFLSYASGAVVVQILMYWIAGPPRSDLLARQAGGKGVKINGKETTIEQLIETWKQRAAHLKIEVYALYLAYRDPRVPWYARVFAACVVGYAFSPIDLIPDPIPVLGYLDDLILIPLGVKVALAMIPAEVMTESREKAKDILSQGKPVNWAAAVVIIAIWIILAVVAVVFIVRIFKR
jgi:uncharacterized membrane protein YkvA (DUF1232 family)